MPDSTAKPILRLTLNDWIQSESDRNAVYYQAVAYGPVYAWIVSSAHPAGVS